MDLSSYHDKTIIITGATGYIANNILNQLKHIPCHIIRMSRGQRPLPSIECEGKLTDVVGDLRDPDLWRSHLTEDAIIFHLAAQTSINIANEDPMADLDQNIKPLLTLLEVCRQQSLSPHIVLASTVTTYGLTETLPVNESQPDHPLSIYDLHKIHGEDYLTYYIRQQFVTGCSLRLANVYGPGVTASSQDRGILNMMVRRALQQQPITIYGGGDFLRDYVYIDDVGAAFLAAGKVPQAVNGQRYIISSGEAHSFKQAMGLIAQQVTEKIQQDVVLQQVEPPKPLSAVDLRNFAGDSQQFQQATQWQATVPLHQGIKQTIAFYHE